MDHMADELYELDELYGVEPTEFTATRARLASAAKRRGDAEAAKRISAARRPTTAAWVVNLLVRKVPDARERMIGLGERLRAAHAAMDGTEIRVLSRQQRALVDELSRAAFEAAAVSDPSAALREDVTGTLQAAIADPDAATRLGRLVKAERWSGFGGFGDTTTIHTATIHTAGRRPVRSAPAAPPAPPRRTNEERAALIAAEQADARAHQALSERHAELAAARLRRDDARGRLEVAEAAVDAAQRAYDEAKEVNRAAAESVRLAKARLGRVEADSASGD